MGAEGGGGLGVLWRIRLVLLKRNHQFEGDRWRIELASNIYNSKKFIAMMPKTHAILQLVSTPLLYLFDLNAAAFIKFLAFLMPLFIRGWS